MLVERLLFWLARFRSLSIADRRLVVRAFVNLAIVDVKLRVFGFRRVMERSEFSSVTAPYRLGNEELLRISRYADIINIAARHHLINARCLHRSLVLQYWLRREGVPSELRIGVKKDRETILAHAWVEVSGQVVNDPPEAVKSFITLTKAGGQTPKLVDNAKPRQTGRLISFSRVSRPPWE